MRLFFMAFGLGLAACSATSKVDLDDDGYSALDDCNDSDPNIFPGADEICDGFDNDCDGAVDNDAIDGAKTYLDGDGDGFGNEASEVVACQLDPGYVDQAGDCDDGNSAVNPDAQEVCDLTETDDDCDGLVNLFDDSIDVSTTISYYPDVDQDGYGDTFADVTLACSDPSTADLRYVTNNNDCNDSSNLAKPGGIELCDGLDNDCDATTDEDGMVMSVDRSGGRQDRTATFSAGTPSKPISYRTIGEETLYFCDGTHYANIQTEYSLDLKGVNGDTRTVLSGASRGSVVEMTGDSIDVTISGLTIEGGQAFANDTSAVEYAGGGVHCNGASTLVITDSKISDNTADESGGGIYGQNCTITIENTEIAENTTEVVGGGIMLFGGSITLNETTVSQNDAGVMGAGIALISDMSSATAKVTTFTMNNSVVTSNTAAFYGGGILIDGGSTASCTASTGRYGVFGNDALRSGGGVFLADGDFESTGCDFGSTGTEIPFNTPDTIHVMDLNVSYDYTEDATFACTTSGCK